MPIGRGSLTAVTTTTTRRRACWPARCRAPRPRWTGTSSRRPRAGTRRRPRRARARSDGATCSTAPEEMPAKIPSASVSSRVARRASEESTRNFRSTHGLVEDRRHEPIVQRPEPVDELAELRLGGDHLDRWVVGAQATPHPGQGPPGPEARDEVRELGEVADDLLTGPAFVGERVRGVPVLEGHEVALVHREPARDLDRAVRPGVAGRGHDLGPEELEQADALLARVVRDHDGQAVPLAARDHRERDPRVAGGRLEDRPARFELARCLGGLDHRLRDPVLRRAGRVLSLELGPQAHAGLRGRAREPDERRLADRVEDVGISHQIRGDRIGQGHPSAVCSWGRVRTDPAPRSATRIRWSWSPPRTGRPARCSGTRPGCPGCPPEPPSRPPPSPTPPDHSRTRPPPGSRA